MGGDGGGGWGINSSKKPGRKSSILSCVACHSANCSELSCSPSRGRTRIPEAFMTKTTFFSDSGTASY